jgi:hypothetical protein
MMKFLVSILLCGLLISCAANTMHRNVEKTNAQADQKEVKQKAEQLKKKYEKLSSSPYTAKYEQEYFEAFPNSFALFNSLFGYTNGEQMGKEFKAGPLYNEAESYVSAFFNVHAIEKSKYYNRMIDISINGRWYADGVNYFKHGMEDKVKSDLNLLSELLSKHSDKEIKSFWYFYFDGPHPAKELQEELQKVNEINSRIFTLMEVALKKVQQAWKE